MNKILYAGDQEQLFDGLDGALCTYFDDLGSVKSASSCVFSEKMMQDHIPDDKHFAAHVIALGAGEFYGPNKNLDFWNEQSLKHNKDNYGMHTFVKNGHVFREHRNRDPKYKIGDIKAAAYNDEMHRGELIIHVDKRKAEQEYEDAKAGKDLDWSMSAKVAGDICSCCGHFARRSADYCACVKNNLGKWMKKHAKFVYVDNVKPNFFDISKVANRADRIAKHLEIRFAPGEQEKSANFNGFVFSDVQAAQAGICLPDSFQLGCFDPHQQQWLVKLAAVEHYVNQVNQSPDQVAQDDRFQFLKQAAVFAFPDGITDEQLAAMRRVEPSVLFGFLAKRASVMPFKTFFAYTTNQTVKAASEDVAYHQAMSMLPTLLQDMLTSPADTELEVLFDPAGDVKMAAANIANTDVQLLTKFADSNSLAPRAVRTRILEACTQPIEPVIKQASSLIISTDNTKAKTLANAYAHYKIAFVRAVADSQGQELFDDATMLLLISNHNN